MIQDDSKKITRLDAFFETFDAIEDDISEMASDESDEPREIGGYECLFIAFSNLRLYCDNAEIPLSQIDEQYRELKESKADEETFSIHKDLEENNEIISFCKLLEQVEDSFAAFEKRLELSGEVFDEWNCVFIMYSYLKEYCVKKQVDFEKLQEEISHLHAEMEKDEKP